MKVEVFDVAKKAVGELELDDGIFDAPINEHLLWETVKWQLARRRSGTHKTKGRSEVSGGGAKPYRQKGTGRARRGTTRAPHHVGGGTQFGPTPRDYSYPMNKKARRAAMRSALSLRAGTEGGLFVVDSINLDAPKTKQVAEIVERFGLKSVLFVDGDNKNLSLSTRNLPKAKCLSPLGLNVFDLLRYDTLVLTTGAAEAVQQRLGK